MASRKLLAIFLFHRQTLESNLVEFSCKQPLLPSLQLETPLKAAQKGQSNTLAISHNWAVFLDSILAYQVYSTQT